MTLELNRIYNMDCLDGMKKMENNIIDSVVTDPPYGLSFMGKDWDHGTPGIPFWQEALRISKPGAHLLAFGGTRTHHRLMVAIEDAGWEIRDCLMWVYGSGFPKSLDVSKAIDKGAPRAPLYAPFAKHYAERRKAAGLTHAQICDLVEAHGEVNHGGASVNWEKGYGVPTVEQWEKLIPIINPSGDWLAVIKRVEAKREVIGKGYRIDNHCSAVPYGSGTPDGHYDITAPATDAAKAWDGWGTALKPAWEPIVLARKPLDGTVAENMQKWGCGGINIDQCRVAYESTPNPATNPLYRKLAGYKNKTYPDNNSCNFQVKHKESERNQNVLGRFPANLIHDGSDEVLALFPNTKSGMMKPGQQRNASLGGGGYHGDMPDEATAAGTYGDNGSAARFFYCAKASPSERNFGCENLPQCSPGECTDRKDGAVGLNSPRAGAGRTTGAKNNHPTVKPIALMRYLCRLITPPNGLIVDPFCGSGSTGVAGLQEGFQFIGFEKEQSYFDAAEKRIKKAQGQGKIEAWF